MTMDSYPVINPKMTNRRAQIRTPTQKSRRPGVTSQIALVCGGVAVAALVAALVANQHWSGKTKRKHGVKQRAVAQGTIQKRLREKPASDGTGTLEIIPVEPSVNSLLTNTLDRMRTVTQDLKRPQRSVRPPSSALPDQRDRKSAPSHSLRPPIATDAHSRADTATPTRRQDLKSQVNSIGMHLILLPAGRFRMGCDGEQVGVLLTKPFWIGKYEVTQEEWTQVIGRLPPNMGQEGDKVPVTNMGWHEAITFCDALTERERASGRIHGSQEYLLPTDAEWEYACRAGTTTKYCFGDDDALLPDYAWCFENAFDKHETYAHPVGQLKPNAWGIYDMHGNVDEYCYDEFAKKPPGGTDPFTPHRETDYEGKKQADPGGKRVVRSSNWSQSPYFHQCGLRGETDLTHHADTQGFRVVLTTP